MSSSTPSTIEVDELARTNGFHISNEDITHNDYKHEHHKENKFEFLKRMFNYIKISLMQLTVEPIIFLVYLGWIFGNTIQSPGMYRRFAFKHRFKKTCLIFAIGLEFVKCITQMIHM